MRHTKYTHYDHMEDPQVVRARRKETMRGAIKLFRVLMDAVERHADWARSHAGMDPARLWALWELRQMPGLRAVDLAKAMAVHRNTAETMLIELADEGLVTALPALLDRPAGHTLTEAGKRLIQAVPDHAQGALMSALGQLPDAALDQLVQALRPLMQALPFREDRAALRPLASRHAPVLPRSDHPPLKRTPHAKSD